MKTDGTITTWLRLVLSAAMALAVGMAITPYQGGNVAEAASVVPETAFVIDGNPQGPNDFLAPYGPGLSPNGYPTTGLYYNDRSVDEGGVSGCNISNDPSTPTGGTKIGDGPAYPTPGTDPNGKTDLDYIDIAAEKVNKLGQVFDIMYVGYQKCGGSGTWQTSLYLDDGDGVLPSQGDANGDYLFLFEFQPSSGTVEFREYRRVNGVWTVQPLNTTFIDGFASQNYGEVALNLTGLVFTDDNGGNLSCNSLVVSGPAASITGGSFGLSSQPKDLLAFDPLQIDNCGAIDITKLAADGTATASAPFHYLLEQADDLVVHDGAGTLTSTPAGLGEPDADRTEIDADINLGATHNWVNVLAQPDYDLTETSLPVGWELQSITCTYYDIFPVPDGLGGVLSPPGERTTVLYANGADTGNLFLIPPFTIGNNPIDPASCTIVNDALGITLVKDGVGTADTVFTFDIDGGAASDVPVTINGDSVFQTVPASGTYTITEDDINALDLGDSQPDWTLANIVCTDTDVASGAPTYDLAAGTATVTVDGADDDIVCTFTNNQAARIFVEKVTDPGTADTFDFDVVGPQSVDLDGIANGGSLGTGDIQPGSYTITEVMPASDPAWVLTAVDCALINPDGLSVDVSVAAGETLTCQFSNQQQGAIVIDKQVVEPGTSTLATDQDTEFSFTGDAGGDIPGTITTTSGETAPGDELESNPVMPGNYTVTEDTATTPGYTLESVVCDDGDSVQSGNSAAIVVASGETVGCTFSNSRNEATFTLEKSWGAGTLDGAAVDLDAGVTAGAAPIDAAIATTATALSESSVYAPLDRLMTVYSGQTITFSETFEGSDGDGYTTTLDCGAVGSMTLTPAADGRSGTLVVGNNPSNVTCRFINVPKQAGVTLQKVWVDALAGDTADLSLDTAPTGATDDAQSVAPAAADDTNSAFVSVVAGDTVTFSETVSNDANYTVQFDCTAGDAPINTPQPSGGDYTLEISTADVANGSAVVCRFTNTRIAVDLTLEKDWDDAQVGDAVMLSATGSDTTPIAYASDAATADETDTSGTFTVFAGETLTLGEAFTNGDPAAYDSSLSCSGATDTDVGDGLLDIDPTDTSITCTWVNARRSVNVVVAKSLSPITDDGTFDLSIDGNVEVAAATDGGSNAATPVSVLVGDSVTVLEAAAGSVALANYTSSLACDNDIAPANNTGTTGDFVIPSTLASDTTITCTFTNVRNEAPLTVTKSWGTSPVDADPDLADLTISGGLATPINGNNSNDAVANDVDATSTVYGGETITVAELLQGTRDATFYDTTLVCSDADGNLVDSVDSLTGEISVPADPTAISCTFTNQRKSTTLSVDKDWVNAQTGDAAEISITGIDPASIASGTSTVTQPNQTDAPVASMTVWAGETVDLEEVITLTDPQDAPRYSSTLTCPSGTTQGRTGSVTVTPADDTPISCSFRNVRRGVDLVLVKDWAASPQNGDTVALYIDGGLIPVQFGNPVDQPPTAPNSNDGDDGNDVTARARVLVGETISLSEDFTTGLAENYDTAFECRDVAGALVDVAYTAGALGATLDVAADLANLIGDVTCTFTNTRKSTDLQLAKAWNDAVGGDTADLTATGQDALLVTDTNTQTATAPAGDGTSADTAAITVYAGQVVTLSEVLGAGNTATYDATAFTCTSGDQSPAWALGDLGADLAVSAADIDAANLAGEPITCTFTNTAQRGTIVVVKSIDGVNDGTFDFSGDWSTDGVTIDPVTVTDPTGFSITTDTLTGAVTFSNVLIGSYTVSETDSGSSFDGTSVTCVEANGDDGSGPAGNTDLPLTGDIDLDNGETVTCTFTNTERSTIVVVKDAQPDAAQDFSFTTTEPAAFDLLGNSFDLDDDADATLSNTYTSVLVPGGETYSVTELDTAGWTLDPSSACTPGGSFNGTTATITPAPGATVTCTFVNTANPAGISATKAVSNQVGPWGPFEFTLTGGTFTGAATQAVDSVDATADWADLVEGAAYTLTENAVAGYEPGAVFTCQVKLAGDGTVFETLDDADAATDGFQFTAAAGAIYDCDITNVAISPTLVVAKTTVGGFGTFTFDVTPTDVNFPAGPLTATTADGTNPADSDTVDLMAGVGYTVAEQLSDEWVEGTLTCVVTDATGGTPDPYTFGTPTAPGDVIECEITNTRRGQIIVEKQTIDDDAPGEFGFEASWIGLADAVADFSLADNGTQNSGLLDPGVDYTITELSAFSATFSLTNITCSSDGPGSGDQTSIGDASAIVSLAPGETVTCVFTNSQRGPVEIVKTSTGPVSRDGDTYTVAFELDVTTESTITEAFTLDDIPTFADGVTITSTVITDPAAAEIVLPYNGSIDPGQTLTFLATFEFTIDGDVPISARTCDGTLTATFNTATVTSFVSSANQTSSDCEDIPVADVSVDKVADAPATYVGGNGYQATYTVTVSNAGDGPASYSLADLTEFGLGAAVTNIAIDGNGITESQAGPGPLVLGDVTPIEIAAAVDGSTPTTHVYIVTVDFTVDPTMTPGERACSLAGAGDGGYNGVTVVVDGIPVVSNDCVDIPLPGIDIEKSVITDPAQPVQQGNTNVYTVTYQVTVDNDGDGPGVYSAIDAPAFGDGATITNVSASSTVIGFTPVSVDNPVAAVEIVPVGAEIPINPDDVPHVYTVVVTFTVAGDMPVAERICDANEGGPNQGTYNSATATVNAPAGTDESNDCADIPSPNVDDTKTLVGDGAVYNGSNQWTVTYELQVTNLPVDDVTPAGPAEYSLTDTLDFGPGVAVDSVTLVPDTFAPAAFDGDVNNVVAQDRLIAGGDTHTYTVVANVTIVPTASTNGDCTADGGLNNVAGLSVSTDVEVTRPDREACASFSTLTLIKQLDNSDGGALSISDFVLTATGADATITGTTLVSESVPAGDYALTETQQPGYSTDGYVCVGGSMSGQTVTVPLGANVSCTIVNDDEAVDLQLTKDDGGAVAVAGGAPFTYTISVQNIGTRDVDEGEPVTVTDNLPAGLVWVSFPATCSQAVQVLTCDIEEALLPAGGAPVVISATVRALASAASGTYVNKASVTTEDDTTTNPPCPALSDNNVDCEETPVNRQGAIQITKTDNVADGASVEPGGTFTYRLVVTNTGVSTILPGTHVADDLPAQLVFVSAVGGAGWTCNNSDPVDCDYAPALAPGQTAPAITVTVRVAANASGANIQNVAVVLGAVDRNCPSATSRLIESFTPACNQVTDDDNETTPLTANADLAIVKTASVEQAGAGGGFNWILDITNNGPGTAVNVVIGDLVPPAVTVTAVSSDIFACGNEGNTVNCTIASLAVGASGTVIITVSVPLTVADGNVVNVGTVESDTPDPDLSNNSDEATVFIVAIVPPTTTLPPVTLPPTGSNATDPLTNAALVFLLLGGAFVLITRRRRHDGVLVD